MIKEFERYGLSFLRLPVAVSEILCALGLLLGIYFKSLIVISSSILIVLMFGAIAVRIKINDQLIKFIPAIILLIVNLIILINLST